MIAVVLRVASVLMMMAAILRVASCEFQEIQPHFAIEPLAADEFIRHIHSMMKAYRGGLGNRLVVETDALINTKYRTWKRNADIINSLLALPKGMNDAGR